MMFYYWREVSTGRYARLPRVPFGWGDLRDVEFVNLHSDATRFIDHPGDPMHSWAVLSEPMDFVPTAELTAESMFERIDAQIEVWRSKDEVFNG